MTAYAEKLALEHNLRFGFTDRPCPAAVAALDALAEELAGVACREIAAWQDNGHIAARVNEAIRAHMEGKT